MNLSITIQKSSLQKLNRWIESLRIERFILWSAAFLVISATVYAYMHDYIIAYGDAESHLNIAKRVVDSLTPGLAQLGGIWLPLPHLLLAPFVYLDFFWRTGLAGSFISGAAYIISALFLYKLTILILQQKTASLLATLVFMLNPNILYLATTPMTELPLLVFFILATYFFVKFLHNQEDLLAIIFAAFFGFCATLARYDGWFLVLAMAGIIVLMHIPYLFNTSMLLRMKSAHRQRLHRMVTQGGWSTLEGKLILFATLAFFGILLWLTWDALILGDPLFFTHSEFSAKSQQQGWLARGQLPSYLNLIQSFTYYLITSMSNIGVFIFFSAIAGLYVFMKRKDVQQWFPLVLLLLVPFLFYVITLFLGQSIIFIPHLTPPTFEWTLFNVRYGAMMVPAAAIFFGYLFLKTKPAVKILLLLLFTGQFFLYTSGYSQVITLDDGINGLSTAKRPDADYWMAGHYDGGLVLLDDFSRTISIIRSGIPMKNIIYIGNKPYWEESLEEPEKYATWIVLQQNDMVWKSIYEPEHMRGRLYAHFTKVYTSPEILIFKRTGTLGTGQAALSRVQNQ